MGQAKAYERGTRSPKATALLVIAVVAAASVALGLTVVGPMLKRKWEPPAPSLALNSPTPAAPMEAPRAEAEVQIKERIIPRPKPKPPPELMVPLVVPTLSESSPGTASREISEESGTSTSPSIHATVSDSEPGADRKRGRDSARATGAEGADGGEGATDGAHKQDGPTSRTRRRRLSPLEALPTLGSSLPRTPAPERGAEAGASGTESSPAAGSGEAGRDGQAGDRDARRSGQSYRVQVGRFAEENDARRLRDELEGAGLSPRVVKTERDGVVLYRVQVGTFKMKENADRQVDQLKQQRYEPYIADDEP